MRHARATMNRWFSQPWPCTMCPPARPCSPGRAPAGAGDWRGLRTVPLPGAPARPWAHLGQGPLVPGQGPLVPHPGAPAGSAPDAVANGLREQVIGGDATGDSDDEPRARQRVAERRSLPNPRWPSSALERTHTETLRTRQPPGHRNVRKVSPHTQAARTFVTRHPVSTPIQFSCLLVLACLVPRA